MPECFVEQQAAIVIWIRLYYRSLWRIASVTVYSNQSSYIPGWLQRKQTHDSNFYVTVHTPLSREAFWHKYAKIPSHTSQNSIAAGNLEWILATLLRTEWTVTFYSIYSNLLTDTSYATLFSVSFSPIRFIYSLLWIRPQIRTWPPTSNADA